MNFEPVVGCLVLKPVEDKEITTESGIIISHNSAESSRSIRGEVLATGKQKLLGSSLVDMQAKVGDTVLFDTYKASELQYEGITYYKIEEDKIFAILR